MRSVVKWVTVLVLLAGCADRNSSVPPDADAGLLSEPRDAATPPANNGERDAASKPTRHNDAGSPPTAADAGAEEATVDAGEKTPAHEPSAGSDAGVVTHPQDTATTPAPAASDSGTPYANDASTPPAVHTHDPIMDASTPPVVDAGNTPVASPVDAAAPQVDSGSAPEPDAATPVVDAGNPPLPDAGATPSMDAATAPLDAGQPTILDSGTPATPDAAPAPADCSGPPGMYKDDKCQVLSDGLKAYHPKYPLWSDGALKERFIYLPPGSQIDTSDPDRWNFPVGTRFYKSFAAGTVRVETRVLEKTKPAASFDSWTFTSYAWSADQHSVSAAAASGVTNALGTGLDIPSQANCRTCHTMQGLDAVNGFGAIQLNHSEDGVTLSSLLAEHTLINGSAGATLNVSVDNARIPGDAATQAALGYLQGNCGHCHGGPTPRVGMQLWSIVGMTQLSDAPIMQTAVCHCIENWTGRKNADGDAYTLRVAPGHAAVSGIVGRMSARTSGEQMPPLGTKLVDPTGLGAIKTWIDSLDATSCQSAAPVCVP
jgi:hypothetical protein